MGRGSSKAGGGGGGNAITTSTKLDLNDVTKLTKQLQSMPIGSQLRRVDDDNTVVYMVKSDESAEPWTITTFLGGGNTASFPYSASNQGVAITLNVGHNQGSKVEIRRIGM